jgi:type IV secretory pathway TrbL component
MKRWLGWTMVLGLGGALATGCVSRQEEGAQQASKPYDPINQKHKSPAASEAENVGGTSGTGGAGTGEQGVAMPEPWKRRPDNSAQEDRGPYQLSTPQAVPRERRPAPFGVGAGPDNARKMAQEQLKTQ